jgi:membrane associated rhomboid family serine protease
MALNVVVLVLQFAFPDMVEYVALSHGDGLHPLQWLTSNFVHVHSLLILDTLLFLFMFGIVVEGKVGPWIFTLLYISVGFFQCMVEQVVCLQVEPGLAFGTRGGIFGIMVVAVVWAPQDNIKTILVMRSFLSWFRGTVNFFGIPIALVGLLYFLLELTIAIFSSLGGATALFSIFGSGCGLLAGIGLLLLGWVDCEQRDIISMFRELFGKAPIKKRKTKSEIQEENNLKKAAMLEKKKKLLLYRRSIAAHLAAGNPEAASKTFRQVKRLDSKAEWSERDILRLISSYQKESQWDQVITLSNSYFELYRDHAALVSLNLAKVILLQKDSPRKALSALQQIENPAALDEPQKQTFRQIVAQAKKMIADGAIELDDHQP